ncbi:GntR family transcriptional regulator [Acidimangrovimonas sediminis]|uniref:GntR family transcriptional regulator n=1 Tax=Acidimangrovimonas sediminis TaxID=2056283 RepID=UPI000C80A0E8|nr:GntR family transcriptional regulator [Acidimangrovimonas sediminis]
MTTPGAGPKGWEAIRAEVLRRIDRREWAPGAVIPPEAELAEEFGVARATVNRALRELALQGVVERRRKAGTRVATHPVRRAVVEIPVTRLEVEGRGQCYAFHLTGCALVVPPPPVLARLGLAPGSRMWHVTTLHLADGRPFLYEDRWLNPAPLPAGFDPSEPALSINEWLVKNVAYTYGDIAFSAEPASEGEALQLDVPKGAPVFVIERTTWAGEVPVTLVRLAYGPGYRLRTVL